MGDAPLARSAADHVAVAFQPPQAARGVLYLTTAAAAASLRAYVEAGGHLLVSFFSGIVDQHDRIHPGAHPGALRDLLGLTVEEFHPLPAGETVGLARARPDGPGVGDLRASVWSEAVRLAGAEAVWRYRDGPDAGEPAVTRHGAGRGGAWYVSTRLDVDGIRRVLADVLPGAGVQVPAGLPEEVEVVRRHAADASFLFLINHGAAPATAPARGTDLLTGTRHDGQLMLPPSGVAVLRQPLEEPPTRTA